MKPEEARWDQIGWRLGLPTWQCQATCSHELLPNASGFVLLLSLRSNGRVFSTGAVRRTLFKLLFEHSRRLKAAWNRGQTGKINKKGEPIQAQWHREFLRILLDLSFVHFYGIPNSLQLSNLCIALGHLRKSFVLNWLYLWRSFSSISW